eukprot:2470473-Amphidinium_carterae.1
MGTVRAVRCVHLTAPMFLTYTFVVSVCGGCMRSHSTTCGVERASGGKRVSSSQQRYANATNLYKQVVLPLRNDHLNLQQKQEWQHEGAKL